MASKVEQVAKAVAVRSPDAFSSNRTEAKNHTLNWPDDWADSEAYAFRVLARAAIATYETALAEEGYVVVPREILISVKELLEADENMAAWRTIKDATATLAEEEDSQ